MDLARQKSPEERELEKKRAELAGMEPGLAERELELATLRVALSEFERRYLTVVGTKYAQLDEIEAQMYEEAAKMVPEDTEAQIKAEAGREQAKASAEAAKGVEHSGKRPGSAARAFEPSEQLKTLFRTAAKAL